MGDTHDALRISVSRTQYYYLSDQPAPSALQLESDPELFLVHPVGWWCLDVLSSSLGA